MTKKPAGTPTTISACDITVSEVNKAGQIEQYYLTSTFGTDSAPLKKCLETSHFRRSRQSLRDPKDTKDELVELKYEICIYSYKHSISKNIKCM